VLGHPAYYPRFGFFAAGPFGFRYAGRDVGPAFMLCELAPGAARRFGGEVRFLPAFDALEEP
jgi:putative acetyltransferase